ncbi:hypothetical protein V3C99_014246 [Haemonchus contortus]|uniref:Uncharacterized protein n=1 Tax=Haemonchus contortus TaxID=6289 RepID=A0A7I4YGN1_HAECO
MGTLMVGGGAGLRPQGAGFVRNKCLSANS